MAALGRIMRAVRAHSSNKGRLETLIQLTSLSLSTPPVTVSHAAFRLQRGAIRGICLFVQVVLSGLCSR